MNKLISVIIFTVMQLAGFTCLYSQTNVENYVFFNLDRESIRTPSFYNAVQFTGAQIKYTWRSLEKV
jgi:hypothetical protein